MVRSIKVSVPGGEYRVHVGAGARERLTTVFRGRRAPSRFHLITDESVYACHGTRVERLLKSTGIPTATSVLPAGESSKSPRHLVRVWRDVLSAGCDRSSCVVAFGGGVIGDLGGFTAASALRGIDFVQVPTTLLAMVDASVGGKTGINLPEGKNLVGAFHQPRAVIADLDFLKTLPSREFRAGCAEVIKTAAIWNASFFRQLERDHRAILKRKPAPLGAAVEKCVRIKAAVVSEDEKEAGLRMILNFGHTFGHALEAVRRYRGLLHGEAVAIGMVFAAEFGEQLGYTTRGTANRIRAIAKSYGLPIAPGRAAVKSVMAAMLKDKKRGRRGLRWVLLPKIGASEVHEGVPLAEVERQVRAFITD